MNMKNELKILQDSINELRVKQDARQRTIENLSRQAQTLSERVKEVLLDAYELNYNQQSNIQLQKEVINIENSEMIKEEKELRLKAIEKIIEARAFSIAFNNILNPKK